MNVSSTTALTCEMKPLEASFLPIDDPRFLKLKYQILILFADLLKTIEVKSGVHEKSEKQKMFIQSQICKGHKSQCTYCYRTDT